MSIISLSEVIHRWDATDRMDSFIEICTHVITLSGIEGIWCGQEYLGNDVVTKML